MSIRSCSELFYLDSFEKSEVNKSNFLIFTVREGQIRNHSSAKEEFHRYEYVDSFLRIVYKLADAVGGSYYHMSPYMISDYVNNKDFNPMLFWLEKSTKCTREESLFIRKVIKSFNFPASILNIYA